MLKKRHSLYSLLSILFYITIKTHGAASPNQQPDTAQQILTHTENMAPMLSDTTVVSHTDTMAPKYSWKNPHIKISPKPRLMGKQMGTVDTIGVQPLGYEMDGNVKIFRLIAQPVEQWLTDGRSQHKDLLPAMQHILGAHQMNVKQKLRGWGYNGSIPGPTIEITEGDTVRVIVKNELPEPTTVHWHGIELPFAQDGSSDADPILPGKTHTYQFTPYQSGTYLYHSGYNIARQEMYGLAGLLVVHPKEGYEHKIDRDIAILLQEWAILPGNNYPNLLTINFNWFTFNGHSAPSIPVITIKQGERVRIRLGTMMMDSHPIHIHGFTWTVVGTEGGPIQKSAQIKGSTINVPVGTTRDVEFVAWNPGSWPFHCHKMHHVMSAHAEVPMGVMPHGGMFTFVNVIPKDLRVPWKHPSQTKPANTSLDAFGYPSSQKSGTAGHVVTKQNMHTVKPLKQNVHTITPPKVYHEQMHE